MLGLHIYIPQHYLQSRPERGAGFLVCFALGRGRLVEALILVDLVGVGGSVWRARAQVVDQIGAGPGCQAGSRAEIVPSCACTPAVQLGLIVLNGLNLSLETVNFAKKIRRDDTSKCTIVPSSSLQWTASHKGVGSTARTMAVDEAPGCHHEEKRARFTAAPAIKLPNLTPSPFPPPKKKCGCSFAQKATGHDETASNDGGEEEEGARRLPRTTGNKTPRRRPFLRELRGKGTSLAFSSSAPFLF